MSPSLEARVRSKLSRFHANQRLNAISDRVFHLAGDSAPGAPILFFNSSTRLSQVSQNAAFSLLTAWSLALDGHPVRFLTCKAGMTRCLLGTNPESPARKPPCANCFTQSRMMFQPSWMVPFTFLPDEDLEKEINSLRLAELLRFTNKKNLPLGKIVLPSLRWILRRHNLEDLETTRMICRDYIRSANNLSDVVEGTLKDQRPAAVVVFNGQFFPEAIVKNLARQRGIRVISHEVALQPLSAFFTEGEATAYPIQVPSGMKLTEGQNRKLDEVLENRFQGNFSMAGIKFWGEMKPFDEAFLQKAKEFQQIVPIFTNVIFDTSQAHANSIYLDMFSWLEDVAFLIKRTPGRYLSLGRIRMKSARERNRAKL